MRLDWQHRLSLLIIAKDLKSLTADWTASEVDSYREIRRLVERLSEEVHAIQADAAESEAEAHGR